jgi:uncharacterized glyoxalase superfamily protein PhnB
MQQQIQSIRPFIGSGNFTLSRSFYRDMGFEEVILSPNMSLFRIGDFGFYLQDAYVKDWVDNTMLFLEVADLDSHYADILARNLQAKYDTMKLSVIQHLDWGREYFLHDPAGILWHIGQFSK